MNEWLKPGTDLPPVLYVVVFIQEFPALIGVGVSDQRQDIEAGINKLNRPVHITVALGDDVPLLDLQYEEEIGRDLALDMLSMWLVMQSLGVE